MDFQALVQQERAKQDAKWGEQNHDPQRWLAILVEEVGEAAKAVLDSRADQLVVVALLLEVELVQTAAVCQAMWESGKRNGWL